MVENNLEYGCPWYQIHVHSLLAVLELRGKLCEPQPLGICDEYRSQSACANAV